MSKLNPIISAEKFELFYNLETMDFILSIGGIEVGGDDPKDAFNNWLKEYISEMSFE
jgi:hypothetical protein